MLTHPSRTKLGKTLLFTWICSKTKGRSVCHRNMHQANKYADCRLCELLCKGLMTFWSQSEECQLSHCLLFLTMPLSHALACVGGICYFVQLTFHPHPPALLCNSVLPMAAFRTVVPCLLYGKPGCLEGFTTHVYLYGCGRGLPAADTQHLKSRFCLVMTNCLISLKFWLYGIKLQFLRSSEQSQVSSLCV